MKGLYRSAPVTDGVLSSEHVRVSLPDNEFELSEVSRRAHGIKSVHFSLIVGANETAQLIPTRLSLAIRVP
jgi:hypothetical protein